MLMTNVSSSTFDPAVFLAHAGLGRRIVELKADENFFTQGDQADSVFYLQHGRVKLTVVSQAGKEATVTLLSSATLSVSRRSRQSLGCACQRRPPCANARRSRSQGKK